jgi:hypothetical protein
MFCELSTTSNFSAVRMGFYPIAPNAPQIPYAAEGVRRGCTPGAHMPPPASHHPKTALEPARGTNPGAGNDPPETRRPMYP